MKLINQIKPEILNFLKSSIKPKYSASYRSIIASLKSKDNYRDLTIDEVDCIQLYLDNEKFRDEIDSSDSLNISGSNF